MMNMNIESVGEDMEGVILTHFTLLHQHLFEGTQGNHEDCKLG
jgi:hypothetical protein